MVQQNGERKKSNYHNILAGRNFSLVACYSLKFARWSLFVVKSLVARSKIYSLLVAKFARYSSQKLLVTKITRYLLQNFPVARCRSCSLQKVIRHSLKQSQVNKVNTLNQKNKQNCMLFLILPFQILLEFSTSNKFHF